VGWLDCVAVVVRCSYRGFVSTISIAIACVGSARQDIAEKLLPYIADEETTMEVAANAALALGYVFVGSANGDIAITIVQSLMERMESTLSDKWARFIALALGLIYLGESMLCCLALPNLLTKACYKGRQEASEATVELLKTIEHPLGKQAEILVDICSYAATGNVLKIQSMLHHCGDHAPKPKKAEKPEGAAVEGESSGEADKPAEKEESPADMTYQAFAVIGIALVAMGEEVGADMALRQFNHLVSISLSD
jgi:26S proteasome regulatory subunit N1